MLSPKKIALRILISFFFTVRIVSAFYSDGAIEQRTTYCDPSGAVISTSGYLPHATSSEFYYTTNNTLQLQLCSNIHKLAGGLSLATGTVFTAVYTAVQTAGNTCNIVVGFNDSSPIGFAGTVLTSPTTTTLVNSFTVTSPADSVWYGLRARTGANSNCRFLFTRLYDSLGNEYLTMYNSASSTSSGGGSTYVIGDNFGNMTSEWECTTSGGDTTCSAVSTTSVDFYNGPSFNEWLLVAIVFLFFLSLLAWNRLSIKP